jgi:hypothetical protein
LHSKNDFTDISDKLQAEQTLSQIGTWWNSSLLLSDSVFGPDNTQQNANSTRFQIKKKILLYGS